MNILMISQAVSQEYIEIIKDSFEPNTNIDIITGSNIDPPKGLNVFCSPRHNPVSLKTRLICWYKHYKYVRKWYRDNRNNHYGLIFATSNPPINSYIGLFLKRKYRTKFVYMNWDLYPQVIQVSINNIIAQELCKLWDKWNKKHYKEIDGMITIGRHVAKTIEESVCGNIKVEVIPIAVDTEYIKPIEKCNNVFIKEHGLEDKFIVLYSGKMGHEHNIEGILEASRLLKEHEKIIFVFIGNGEKYTVVEKYIKDTGSKNVLLFPYQSKEIFPMSIACGDVGIVTVENRSSELMMPSKTYSIMAAGEAVVGLCKKDCDLSDLICYKNIGIVIDSNNPKELANSLLKLFEDKCKLDELRRNSRSVAVYEYDKKIITNMYRKYFQKVLGHKA